jgi:hypothetical protein
MEYLTNLYLVFVDFVKGFDSIHRNKTFWAVAVLERCPPSLVSTTEELLWRKSWIAGLEIREYSRRDLSRWPRGTLYPQTLALTSLTSGGRSVGIVRWRTQATECSFLGFRQSQLILFNVLYFIPVAYPLRHFYIQGWRVSQVRNQHGASSNSNASRCVSHAG